MSKSRRPWLEGGYFEGNVSYRIGARRGRESWVAKIVYAQPGKPELAEIARKTFLDKDSAVEWVDNYGDELQEIAEVVEYLSSLTYLTERFYI